MNIDTLLGYVTWEMIEPEEGKLILPSWTKLSLMPESRFLYSPTLVWLFQKCAFNTYTRLGEKGYEAIPTCKLEHSLNLGDLGANQVALKAA
jgi:hypothetical protein